ncbi:MAG: phage tail spike protein, partial [Bacillus sp. (in: firmicutes)]
MLFILDSKEKMAGVLDNSAPLACHYWNDVYKVSLENNVETLEFDLDASHETANLLEEEGYIIYTDRDKKQRLFIIKEIRDKHDAQQVKSIYCEVSAVGDLYGSVVRPVTMNSHTLERAAAIVLNNTGWKLGNIDFVGVQDIKIEEYTSSLEALKIVVEAFGGELEFEVKFNGSLITDKLVHIVEKRGQNTGKIFEYSKNLSSIERVEDTKELITAIIPVGKADDAGNVLTITGYTPNQEKGFYIEQDYIVSEEAFQKYNKSGRNIFWVYKDDKATNKAELYQNGLSELKDKSKPRVTYSCDAKLFETMAGYEHESVRIGDEVLVKDWTYNPPIVLSARVKELERSKTDPGADKVIFGDYKPITLNIYSFINKIQKTIMAKEAAWDSAKEVAENSQVKAGEAITIAKEAKETALEFDEQIQAQGEIITNFGTRIDQTEKEISLRAAKTEVDSLKGRMSSAETSLVLTHDEVNLKVNKNGVIGAINLSPEAANIAASKINLRGAVTADSIKSLNGLNVNDQFIVDNSGNVTFGGHLMGATGTFTGDVKSIENDYGVIKEATLSNGEVRINTGRGNYYMSAVGDEAALYFDTGDTYTGISFYRGTLLVSGTIRHDHEPITSSVERGFCGVGGQVIVLDEKKKNVVNYGVGVNFRIKKNYVPEKIKVSGVGTTLRVS